MTAHHDVEGLAAKLTEAQKRVIIHAAETVDGRVLVPTILGNINNSTGWPSGLTMYYSAYYAELSAAGLALRSHLIGTGNG